jgi:hypothetical protein
VVRASVIPVAMLTPFRVPVIAMESEVVTLIGDPNVTPPSRLTS